MTIRVPTGDTLVNSAPGAPFASFGPRLAESDEDMYGDATPCAPDAAHFWSVYTHRECSCGADCGGFWDWAADVVDEPTARRVAYMLAGWSAAP